MDRWLINLDARVRFPTPGDVQRHYGFLTRELSLTEELAQELTQE